MSQLAQLSSPATVFQLEAMTPGSLEHLGAHLVQCLPTRRVMHRLRGILEAMHQFMMPRIVSSVAGAGAGAAVLVYIVS